MIRVLSLGAGVQSTTVLLMSCKGLLPKLDCAIFADTQWEPMAVYEHLDWLEREAAMHKIQVHRVTAGNLREAAMHSQIRGKKTDGVRWASMPLYVLNNATGSDGMIKRQCTSEYKIAPIEKFIKRELLGIKPKARAPREVVVEQWFGISSDEMQRMRESREAWKTHVYPLCGWPTLMLNKRFDRRMCQQWLAENYPDRVIPRSACIGCPYHSNTEWRAIKDNPTEWADATEFDAAIRNSGGVRGQVFLHRSCTPLVDVDLRTDGERGQMSFADECEGMCGV